MAFNALNCKHAGVVKATGKIVLQPLEVKTVTGLVRKPRDCESAVTETSEHGCSSKVQISPRVVALNKPGTTARIPVKLFNISAKAITIEPKTPLCGLQEVKVLRSADITKTPGKSAKANVHQQHVAKSESENILNIILTEEQKSEANSFLSGWKHVFSQGPTDLGCTRLVQHEIPWRGSNEVLPRAKRTLYHVAVKAGLYRKAVQVCYIHIPCDILPPHWPPLSTGWFGRW